MSLSCRLSEFTLAGPHERTTGQLTIWLTINHCLTVTIDRSKRTNDISSLHSLWHGLTDRRPITSRLNWPITSTTRVKYHQLAWYKSLWLWRWLPHRLSKCQSLSTMTVLFRTTFTQTIILNLLTKWLLGSNLSQEERCWLAMKVKLKFKLLNHTIWFKSYNNIITTFAFPKKWPQSLLYHFTLNILNNLKWKDVETIICREMQDFSILLFHK